MPDVLAGGNPDDVHNLFCQLWHAADEGGSEDVSLEEFVDFYQDISAVIDDDDEFISLLAASWPVQQMMEPEEGEEVISPQPEPMMSDASNEV